ncbi:MAG TPA: leucyl aminopeptidase [Verrucomicrobiae bacterium]|nr:leucyl aminopeptidase [Verrucomicrobiae bacterium]
MKTELLVTAKTKPADIFIVGVFENTPPAAELAKLEPSAGALLKSAVAKKRFSGKFGEVLSSYGASYVQAEEIVFLGLGSKKTFKKLCCRKAAGQIVKLVLDRKAQRGRVLLPGFIAGQVTPAVAAGIFSEITILASYDFKKYKTESKDAKASEPVLELLAPRGAEAGLRKAMDASRVIAEGVLLTRDLINEPANVLTPPELAARAAKMAEESGVSCKILGQTELAKLKMGGILGVNQGSIHAPALIILEYGKKYQNRGTVCLVGKGVTFDTGGLSIKPSKGMEKMKYDMSGAAAVIGTFKAVAGLKLPVHIVGLAPAVENNVALNPQRPGDIIRMFSGKTVEVLNTDAEGRLILADALAYSARYNPKAIIDLATLTGMCAYTFGGHAIGLMTNDDKLANRVKEAGLESGERCWELPMYDEYAQQIKGPQSDLKNIGGEYAGTITAAKFLQEFVPEKTPWVHLDIAGTAWSDGPRFDVNMGATGVGVRLLTQFLAKWK